MSDYDSAKSSDFPSFSIPTAFFHWVNQDDEIKLAVEPDLIEFFDLTERNVFFCFNKLTIYLPTFCMIIIKKSKFDEMSNF